MPLRPISQAALNSPYLALLERASCTPPTRRASSRASWFFRGAAAILCGHPPRWRAGRRRKAALRHCAFASASRRSPQRRLRREYRLRHPTRIAYCGYFGLRQDPGVSLGRVVTIAVDQLHLVVVPDHHHPVDVLLNFMNPVGTVGNLLGGRRDAGFERTFTHGRDIIAAVKIANPEPGKVVD